MSADLRHLQSTIKDQGRRGTCVACAATAGHELLRAEGIDLCIEFLHWAAKQCDGLPTSSDGTTLLAAAEALAQIGQPPETNWPYDDQRNQWAPDYQPPADACSDATPRRLAGSNELLPTPDALRDALDQGQAPLLGIRLHQTWYDVGSDGYIAIPATGTLDFGGHAILVVGYQNDALIIRNSWGADWGDRGYGYLPASYVSAYGVSAWVLSL